MQLQQDKLELLQGSGGEGGEHLSGVRRAAAQSVEELKAAISNHLHVSTLACIVKRAGFTFWDCAVLGLCMCLQAIGVRVCVHARMGG